MCWSILDLLFVSLITLMALRWVSPPTGRKKNILPLYADTTVLHLLWNSSRCTGRGFAHPGMFCRLFFFTVILLWSPSAKKWGQSSTFQQAVCLETSLEVSPLWCHRGQYTLPRLLIAPPTDRWLGHLGWRLVFVPLPKKIKGQEEAEGPAELQFLAAGCKQRGWTLAGLWAWKCRKRNKSGESRWD